ncbi:MAG: argininosuccinate lyase [Candidatus Omnitrophica bacterium]|nr:argininosuccinate lyase [Candidatus Omnitrophota bacterium]
MTKKLWGGRFKKKTDPDFFEFQKSIQYDYKLAKYDIYHSQVHIKALKAAGMLTLAEAKRIDTALNHILVQVLSGGFKPDLSCEDIHTDIQNKVEKAVGKLAAKLHTFRSRNDQVAFDTRYYCEDTMKSTATLLKTLILSLESLADKYKGSLIPGYTHTQRAQVVYFKDYLGAFSLMLGNDCQRIDKFLKGNSICIGSGALAGQYSFLLDKYKKILKGSKIKIPENSLENVSNRDFVIEALSILSILQMHLSRLAEDFILYSTKEFNYLDLPEEFCTGSSLMPHKKNPDFLELVRGYTGRIYGNLISVLTMMKGLPLTYNRDMQLDKEPLFSSVEIVQGELKILARFIKGIKLNKAAIDRALEDESLYAMKLMEYLVREKKVAFKDAHDIVGKLIRYSEENDRKIKDIEAGSLKKISPHLDRKIIERVFR